MRWSFSRQSNPPFHDRAWRRADLAVWDERWAGLSLPARRLFLTKIRVPLYPNEVPPAHAPGSFPAAVVQEWRNAELIRDEPGSRKGEFVVAPAAVGFAQRIRFLHEIHLLDPARNNQDRYIHTCFTLYTLQIELGKVVEKQTGLTHLGLGGELFEMFVLGRRWPDWVANYLTDPLAGPLLEAVEKAGTVCLPQLPDLLPAHKPAEIRQTLDRLVNYLALFEDLDPATLDLVVGLLPAVAAHRRMGAEPVIDQPLAPVSPEETAAEAGLVVPDLRMLLLEIAAQPPRLKQNGSLYQKEANRFAALFEPLPRWLEAKWGVEENRLITLLYLAKLASFTQAKGTGEMVVLDLTPTGRSWLARSLEEQYAQLFKLYQTPVKDLYWGGRSDAFFLGSNITAVRYKSARPKQPASPSYKPLTPEERQPLRDALYRLFADLPVGTFFAREDFLAYAVRGKRNPLLLGGEPSQVVIQQEMQLLPPLEEVLEKVGRVLLTAFLDERLIPLGCVQLGWADNRMLLARRPRLDVYFGKAAPAAPAEEEQTRVVVQPDFSVIVIGLNPAPAAELAPFCDRVPGRGSTGSLTLRITRESVMRALAAGLPAEQVLARLQKHASTPLPANVATEVRDWTGWVRHITAAPATLLRCPDAHAASRVQGALGKHAERISDTIVAVSADGLTSALRQKLQTQGILVEGARRRKR